jgi:hypothetical protein
VRHKAEGGSRRSPEGPEKLENAALPDVFAFSEKPRLTLETGRSSWRVLDVQKPEKEIVIGARLAMNFAIHDNGGARELEEINRDKPML